MWGRKKAHYATGWVSRGPYHYGAGPRVQRLVSVERDQPYTAVAGYEMSDNSKTGLIVGGVVVGVVAIGAIAYFAMKK